MDKVYPDYSPKLNVHKALMEKEIRWFFKKPNRVL